jgi:hypothetical protein
MTSLILVVIILLPTGKYGFTFLSCSVTVTLIFLSSFLSITMESEASQSGHTDIIEVITDEKYARHSCWWASC